jgi:hypothetical protein
LAEVGEFSILFKRSLCGVGVEDHNGIFAERAEFLNICKIVIGSFLEGDDDLVDES